MDKSLPHTSYHLFYVFLIVSMAAFLSSCSHVSRKDGPPNFYVDASKIPDASPKVEPLSKYGNLNSYRVFGKRYYTMRSSKNYEQVGIASWYGTKFHSRRTSSGEPYNMLAMTAAHKTLPLPTYVEVTNLRNRLKVIVKVNDRGPFEGNRLIDLSYVAAKKLGVTAHGTAKVRVRAIDPAQFDRPSALFNYAQNERPANSRSYPLRKIVHPHQASLLYLQVGAYRNKAHAEKMRQHLLSLLKTPVKIARSARQHALYRVQIGPIKDVVAANKMTSQLKRLGIKTNKLMGV